MPLNYHCVYVRKRDGITVSTELTGDAKVVPITFAGDYFSDGRDGSGSEGAAELSARVQQPVKPIQWRLITNCSARTLGASAELIDWYCCRWGIELFFDALNNGCKVIISYSFSVELVDVKLVKLVQRSLENYRYVNFTEQRPGL